MTHELVWTFENERVAAALVCTDARCQYRLICAESACESEVLHDVRAEGDHYTHLSYDEAGEDVRHEMMMPPKATCAFVDWLGNEPDLIPELCATRGERFEIGRVRVDPVWQGEDGVLWKVTR